MGEVWKARDTRLDRDVALKVSKAEFTAREARAIATFNHPNICTLYDVGPNYLVMEWLDGVTLTGRFRSRRQSLTRDRHRFEWGGAVRAV